MSSLTRDAQERVLPTLERMKPPGGVASAMSVLERIAAVGSIDELKQVIDANDFVISEEFIEVIGVLRADAEERDDAVLAHKMSVAWRSIGFLYESRLRANLTVPASLVDGVSRWKTATSGELEDLSDSVRTNAIARGRALITAPDFSEAPRILRRDVLRWTGTALLAAHSSTSPPQDLDDGIGFLSDATTLCPNYSIDFAPCTLYGGLGLLARYQERNKPTDLETAVLVLRYAVAAAEDNPRPLQGQAGTALTRAYIERYKVSAQRDDLEAAATIMAFTLQRTASDGEQEDPGMQITIAMLQQKLAQHPELKTAADALTTAVEVTLLHR